MLNNWKWLVVSGYCVGEYTHRLIPSLQKVYWIAPVECHCFVDIQSTLFLEYPGLYIPEAIIYKKQVTSSTWKLLLLLSEEVPCLPIELRSWKGRGFVSVIPRYKKSRSQTFRCKNFSLSSGALFFLSHEDLRQANIDKPFSV